MFGKSPVVISLDTFASMCDDHGVSPDEIEDVTDDVKSTIETQHLKPTDISNSESNKANTEVSYKHDPNKIKWL